VTAAATATAAATEAVAETATATILSWPQLIPSFNSPNFFVVMPLYYNFCIKCLKILQEHVIFYQSTSVL
jgi:hypothetical protein